MQETGGSQLHELKTAIRKQAHENRKNQVDKDGISVKIVDRFMSLPEYHAARTVMFYVDVRDEVRTRQALPAALLSGKRIVVPYCVDGELELFHLEDMGSWNLACIGFSNRELSFGRWLLSDCSPRISTW